MYIEEITEPGRNFRLLVSVRIPKSIFLVIYHNKGYNSYKVAIILKNQRFFRYHVRKKQMLTLFALVFLLTWYNVRKGMSRAKTRDDKSPVYRRICQDLDS